MESRAKFLGRGDRRVWAGRGVGRFGTLSLSLRSGLVETGSFMQEPRSLQCLEVWGGNRAVSEAVTMPGLDAWVYSRPYENSESGGDIHYFSSCATGRITRMLVADVSGHGDKVSTVAVALRDLMRRYVNHLDQAKFVRGLNREFGQMDTGGRFATAIAATYWGPTGTLVLCNAGHPRPMWYSGKTKRWSVLAANDSRDVHTPDDAEGPSNVPLGVDDAATYSQIGLRLAPDDLVLLYTDSLTEARSPDGPLLNEIGLLALLSGLDATRPAALVPALLREIDRFTCHAPPGDDVTAMLLKPNTTRAPVSISAGISSAYRTMEGVVRGLLRLPQRNGDAGAGAGPVPWPEISVANLAGPFWGRFNRGAAEAVVARRKE
jgi:sigma-B regulation protein RsbU (phosphoserine phosphatase)